MDDESLERRLRQVRLSAPGVRFADIEARARQRRRPSPLLRLALATAAVWLVAWEAQVATDRSLQAVAPVPPAAMAVEGAMLWPPLARGELWEQWGEDGWYAEEPREPAAAADDPQSPSTSWRGGGARHV